MSATRQEPIYCMVRTRTPDKTYLKAGPKRLQDYPRAHSHRKNLQMNYNPQIHQRRSIRLPGFDFTQPGAYSVTICTYSRESVFGTVTHGEMALNHLGQLAHEEWTYTEIIRAEVQMDEFVIMPNHIHGIITMRQPWSAVGAHGRAPLHRQNRPPSQTRNTPSTGPTGIRAPFSL